MSEAFRVQLSNTKSDLRSYAALKVLQQSVISSCQSASVLSTLLERGAEQKRDNDMSLVIARVEADDLKLGLRLFAGQRCLRQGA
jgi:hypothetical protein